MTLMIRLLSACSLLAAFLIQSASPAGGWSRVAALYRQRVQETGIVGSSLMFVRNGAVAHKAFEGYQDRATKRPVDEHTIYHWASITKTFTGVAIMQLRDRGLLSLDDPVVKYVPELREVHNPVRRHLAGHHPSPDVAQRRVPRGHLAVGRRSAVASVRADALGAGRRDAAVHRAAVQAGHEVQLLESRASSFSAGSSSCSRATTTRSTSPRTSSCRSA